MRSRWSRKPLTLCVVMGVLAQVACMHNPPVAHPSAPGSTDPQPTQLRYALPKTTIVLDLQVERAVQAPGKYCDFLDLFFPEFELVVACQVGEAPKPGENLIAAKMKTSIQGFGITLKGTADDSRTYDVSFDSSWNVDRADSMSFAENGVLTGAEIERKDRTAEIVVGILSNIAKIAGRFVFGGGDLPPKKNRLGPKPPWERDTPAGLKSNFALLSADRRMAYETYWGTGTDMTPERARLELAVRSFEMALDDAKKLAGALEEPNAGSAAVIPELRKQIAERMSADFLGAKTKETWTPTYEVTPGAPAANTRSSKEALFVYSGCGVVEEKARPVKNPLGALRCSKPFGAAAQTVTFRVDTLEDKDPSRVRVPDTRPESIVLAYVRPEPVKVNLEGQCVADVTVQSPATPAGTPTIAAESNSACAFADTPALLAQWGTQGAIPKAGKDFTYTVALYEATGALKSIKLSAKAALDTTTINNAFGVATTLLDAKDTADAEKQKIADAAAAKADELTVLTRTRQILDEKAKIKKLCQELGLTTCES